MEITPPRTEGCKINAEANLEVRGGRNFQYIPPLVSVILHYKRIKTSGIMVFPFVVVLRFLGFMGQRKTASPCMLRVSYLYL